MRTQSMNRCPSARQSGAPAVRACLTVCMALAVGCGAAENGGLEGTGGSNPGSAGTPNTGGSGMTAGSAGQSSNSSAGASGSGSGTALGGAGTGGNSGDGGRGGALAGQGGAHSAGAGPGGGSNGGAATGGSNGVGGANGGGANGGAGGGGTAVTMSMGCGKAPTLKSGALTIQTGGATRKYMLRLPDNYDNTKPYRLMIGFHGATGNATEVAGAQNNGYFGLYSLSAGSTIFVAAEAVGGIWATSDVAYVNDVLDQVERGLCIDTARIGLEGFSQGAAMVWTLACARSKTFRFAIGHSGGGLPNPASCEPIAYLGSLGLQESTGSTGQTTQTDKFAKWAGCTIETLPKAPTGGHLCSDYQGCSAGHPVRWCQYDGGHTPSPTDAGQGSSWMPKEAWKFATQF